MVVFSSDSTGDHEIYYSIYDNGEFSTPTIITAIAGDDRRPAVSWFREGGAVVVWAHDDGDWEIYYGIYEDGIWRTGQITDNTWNDENSAIDFNNYCNGYVAWKADISGEVIRGVKLG